MYTVHLDATAPIALIEALASNEGAPELGRVSVATTALYYLSSNLLIGSIVALAPPILGLLLCGLRRRQLTAATPETFEGAEPISSAGVFIPTETPTRFAGDHHPNLNRVSARL